MAVVQRLMLLSCVQDIYIHIRFSGTSAVQHVYWISSFIYPHLRYISSTSCVLDIYIHISTSQVHQQYSMCTGYLHSYIHILGTQQYIMCTGYLHSYLRYISTTSCVLDIYIHIHISGTLAVQHVYCYLHSYPYLRYISSTSCVLDIFIHISTSQVHQQYIMCTGYLHSYPYLRFKQFIMCTGYLHSISCLHQQYIIVLDLFISIFYVTIGSTSCVLYTEKGQIFICISVNLYIFISISYSSFTHSEYTNY